MIVLKRRILQDPAEHRIINDNSTSTIVLWSAYKINQELATVSGSIITSHTGLSGLGSPADDHTQYILVDGTRAFTSTVSGIAPTTDAHLATKYYVDSELDTLSGTIPYDHDELAGLEDDDHTQYILVDGTRGFTSTVSGVDPTQGYHLTTKEYVDGTVFASIKKHVVIRPEAVKLGDPSPIQAVIGNFSVLQFTTSSTQSVYTSFHIPTDWETGTDVDVYIHWAPVNTSSGTVVWQMTYDAVASEVGEVISNTGTTIYITDDTQNVQDELLESGNMTISGTNLALEDTIGMTFFRNPDHGFDDYVSAASLVRIKIEYTSNKLGEAT